MTGLTAASPHKQVEVDRLLSMMHSDRYNLTLIETEPI